MTVSKSLTRPIPAQTYSYTFNFPSSPPLHSSLYDSTKSHSFHAPDTSEYDSAKLSVPHPSRSVLSFSIDCGRLSITSLPLIVLSWTGRLFLSLLVMKVFGKFDENISARGLSCIAFWGLGRKRFFFSRKFEIMEWYCRWIWPRLLLAPSFCS